MKSIYEYADKVDVPISYGWGTYWRETENGLYELMFCTRWKYPIKAITKSIELSHDTVWMAFEENNIYVSRFYWDNGVKQDVLQIMVSGISFLIQQKNGGTGKVQMVLQDISILMQWMLIIHSDNSKYKIIAGVSTLMIRLMLLLFYFLFKIVEFIGIEKLCKSNAKTVADDFYCQQFRILASAVKYSFNR